MERTLYLILAALGYAIGGAFIWAGNQVLSSIFFGLASVSLLIWVIATGVAMGIREVLDARDGDDALTLTGSGTPEQPR